MENKDILISGASIAGPALAYWLRSQGFNPTVVERAPALRPGGQTVDLRGAGRTVIRRMGLMDRARALTLDQRGIAWVNDRGRVTARMPQEMHGGEGIISEIEILRGDLAGLLYEASQPGTEYLFDDTITGLDQDETGVNVTFEKSVPRRFGLVIGADGLHSVVRSLAFGPESGCVRPIGAYMAWFTAAADATAEIDLDGWFLMHNAPGGLVASARPGRRPGEIKAGFSFRSEPITYDRRDLAGQQDLLARRFAGVGWEAPRLLAAMRTAPDFFFDSVAQVHLDRWSAGRTALVGDAGYCPTPLTGLGTSLALVGAYVLAGELAAAAGDHRIAFTRYEQVMRAYVTQAQKLPPGGLSGYAPMSRAVIRLRDVNMALMTRWPMRLLLAGQFSKAGDIDLPDYEAARGQVRDRAEAGSGGGAGRSGGLTGDRLQ
ncbi:MAG TPA: FAD-dependent monooxygenase [Streptosporangiaceae bacterium]|jgi:2-polyprenyl-6-methoxyphenol hydroxylase-like FAD-dependent oxidoreductase